MSRLPESRSIEYIQRDIDLLSWDSIESVLESLESMPLNDRQQLEAFLAKWDEFDSLLTEQANQLRLNKARYTKDEEYSEKWETFISEIAPRLSKWNDRLGRKLIESDVVGELEGTDYEPFVEEVRTEVELFEEENVPINRELAQLATKYGEISGDWTVDFEGEERTFSEMVQFMESADRDLRRRAWQAMSDRRIEDADELAELFSEMVGKRHQVAVNAGFENYRDYIFEEKLRDYDPDACFRFHELVENQVRPLAREIAEWKKDKLDLDNYKPWDASADPSGQGGLEPFDEVEELKAGVGRMMERLDPELGDLYQEVREHTDLEARPGKEQGGFQVFMPASRRPYIFANATGRQSDVITLIHEAGHAFHSLMRVPRMAMTSTTVPMEFNEVASMSMELLHFDTLDEFYDSNEARKRAIDQQLMRIPKLLLGVARGDAFQHWLYTNPEHTTEQRRDKWLELQKTFKPHVDYSDVSDEKLRTGWHQTLHFFKVPFYYIEYGFAQLGALQVALNAEQDLDSALSDYKEALRLGPTRDTEGLFEAAGTDFVPTDSKVSALMDWIRARLFD